MKGEQGQEEEGAAVDCVRGKVGTVHGITSLQVKHLHRAWQGGNRGEKERF